MTAQPTSPGAPPPSGAGAPAAAAGATGALRAVVTTRHGWPVVAATVTVLSRGAQAGRGLTDDTGAVAVPLSATGPVTVVVAASGYTPSARNVVLPAGADLGTVVLAQVGSSAVPPAGTWTIDPVHSVVRATARHLGISKVEGRFKEFSGRLTFTPDPAHSTVDVTIAAASIDTGNADRDAHLRSPDFLHADRYPTLTYRSTSVEQRAEDRWTVHGLLTIRDISRETPLEVTYLGTGPDPWSGFRCAFLATAELARRDYEMNWNMGLPNGLVLVGPTLKVDLDVQAVQDPPPTP